jgi:hypothetical protein
MEHDSYKQSYLRTLFRFIKMKANLDRSYIKGSKPYIQNSLNVLLNHFSMKQLLSSEELKEEEVAKIAYQMVCLSEKVPTVLTDLKLAVD